MRNKKNVIMVVMLVAVALMSMGYALFATQLNINSTGNITSTWSANFESISSGTAVGGASNASTPSVSGTSANMNVNLDLPGDSMTYSLVFKNTGSVGVIIQDIKAIATGSSAIIYSISGIKVGDKLAVGASKTITIKIEYDSNTTSQPSETSKQLTVTIDAVQDIGQSITTGTPSVNQPMLLSTKILKDNVVYADNVSSPYVTSSTGIDFSQPSSDTNGKGLYYTNKNTEDNKTTYYFRGNVDNNYVSLGSAKTKTSIYQGCYVENDDSSCVGDAFGDEEECVNNWGVCKEIDRLTNVGDELIWRIVRINENGSIKLVADSITVFSKYASSYDPVAASYFNEENNSDSVVKSYLDRWYINTLRDTYANLLSDTFFCNDRTLGEFDNENDGRRYGANHRLSINKKPNFSCPDSNDVLSVENGKLDYPIGLLTADEVTYAGASMNARNNEYYLSNQYSSWTMSPSYYYNNSGSPFITIYLEENGLLTEDSTLGDLRGMTYNYGARAVINLKSTVEITGGNGTIDSPYTIKLNK